jgi:hypothetical protein
VQLLDVARPPVAHEDVHGLGRADEGTVREASEQVWHQLGDVLDVVAQRRHLDGPREAGQQLG